MKNSHERKAPSHVEKEGARSGQGGLGAQDKREKSEEEEQRKIEWVEESNKKWGTFLTTW